MSPGQPYEIKITRNEQNGVIGHAVRSGEVVYSSAVCSTPHEAIQHVVDFIRQGTPPASPLPAPGRYTKPAETVVVSAGSTPRRRCCGRG